MDTHVDAESEVPIAIQIVDAIANASEIEPIDLPPLYEVVDPDAINSFFRFNDDTSSLEGFVGFRFGHWNVFVSADGRIRVCDARTYTEPVPIFEGYDG